jgi:hypothetical protein
MTKTSRLLLLSAFGLLALFVTACVPSLNPFYTAQDVAADPGLPGAWVDAKGGDNPDSWTFSPAEGPGNPGYTLTVTDNGGKSSGKFKAVLFKLGSERFLDLEPTQVDLADTQSRSALSRMKPVASPGCRRPGRLPSWRRRDCRATACSCVPRR